MALGNRVKIARKHRGLSQSKLAQMSGTLQATISALEKYDRKSSKSSAAIANALGVRISWLLTGEGPMISNSPQEDLDAHISRADPFRQLSDTAMPVKPKGNSEEIERISERLDALNYKWADLARALSTNDQSVYNWRVRDGGIPKAYLVMTARFLGGSVDWLLTGEGAPSDESRPGQPTTFKESGPNSTVTLLVEQLTKAHRRIGHLENELNQARES